MGKKKSKNSYVSWDLQTEKKKQFWERKTYLEISQILVSRDITKLQQSKQCSTSINRHIDQWEISQVVQWKRIQLPMQETQEIQVQSLSHKILWSRKWQPTPVFLPEKFHGQRSLESYIPWGHKELDMTEQMNWAEHYIMNAYIEYILWLNW